MFARSQPLLSPNVSGGGASHDFTRDAYVALVNVLHVPPADISHVAAIGVCATNFSNVMVPALKRGHLSIDTAFKYLALNNPFTGENVFAETGHLPRLVESMAESVIERVSRGAAVSQPTLAALRGYVASPSEIGIDASVAAFKGLIAGCMRCFSISAPHQSAVSSAPDPIAEISALAAELKWAAMKFPHEVAQVVSRIVEVPVHPVLSTGVDAILAELSDPGANVAPEVRHVAKVARSQRAR